ncbi:MAG: hypothetical protein JOZ93_11225 [Sinobacteraceae bacterium]|nr:hypothetical protein [Nevskiaceae bacterium]
MKSHSMTQVEIARGQSQERPDANVYQADSGNHAMARGGGRDSRAHRFLELGFQQQRGRNYDQRSSNGSEPPPSKPQH